MIKRQGQNKFKMLKSYFMAQNCKKTVAKKNAFQYAKHVKT